MSLCVIVGAGEGLGRSLAAKFSLEGYDIALVSRSKAGAQAASEAATKANAASTIRFFAADASRPETIEKTLANVQEAMGPVDVLIYNVRDSFQGSEPLDLSYTDLEHMFAVEVIGAFAAAKAVIPSMRERNTGSVFFSSATAAYRGSARNAAYSMGKFGVRALSQSLAKAYARDGVHVVHVRLDCDLDMPLMRQLYGDADTSNLADPDAIAETYWWTHQQPRAAWSNEIELRPHTETWTY